MSVVDIRKPSLSELDAAAAFVREISSYVLDQWPSLEAVLTGYSLVLRPGDRAVLDDDWARLEFALAALAEESQALGNLLPPDQGRRILDYVLALLDSRDLEGAAVEGFNAYREAWRRGLERNEPPFDEVASLLYDRVGFQGTAEVGGVTIKAPLLLMAISTALFLPGQGWWQSTLARHTLVVSTKPGQL